MFLFTMYYNLIQTLKKGRGIQEKNRILKYKLFTRKASLIEIMKNFTDHLEN